MSDLDQLQKLFTALGASLLEALSAFMRASRAIDPETCTPLKICYNPKTSPDIFFEQFLEATPRSQHERLHLETARQRVFAGVSEIISALQAGAPYLSSPGLLYCFHIIDACDRFDFTVNTHGRTLSQETPQAFGRRAAHITHALRNLPVGNSLFKVGQYDVPAASPRQAVAVYTVLRNPFRPFSGADLQPLPVKEVFPDVLPEAADLLL